MKITYKSAALGILIGAVVTGLIGCRATTKKEVKAEELETVSEGGASRRTKVVSEIKIGPEWTVLDQLQSAFFDFDRADLRGDARGDLKANAALLKKLPNSVQIMIEGHCDDRGTIEYNVALGQRRANAVRDYYAHSGVSKTRLQTISYGEERPACESQDEPCWAKNRRGATKVRSDQPVTIKPGDQ